MTRWSTAPRPVELSTDLPGDLPDDPPPARALPQHVAVIMDGNGRWAAQRGLRPTDGHRAGTENIRSAIEAFAERGIRYLTLFAFSTENWSRPRPEVRGLMRILSSTIDREVQPLHEAGVQLRYIGRIDALSAPLRRKIDAAVARTRRNTRMTVCVAFNYGGRAELVDAVRRIAADGIAPQQIDEALIDRYLYTGDMPDPDLIIRTGGDQRISNFLLWQAAYAEYVFTPTWWPDFGAEDVDAALAAYARRCRNFGGRNGTAPANANGDAGRNGR